MSQFDTRLGLHIDRLSAVMGQSVTLKGDGVDNLVVTAISVGAVEGTEEETEDGRVRMRTRSIKVKASDLTDDAEDYQTVTIGSAVWALETPSVNASATVVSWRATRRGKYEESRAGYRRL